MLERSPSPPAADADRRSGLLTPAVKTWAGQLVDLTARNNLLFFKDLKAGTLDVGSAPTALLFELLAGRTVTLSRLFSDPDERAAAAKRARVIHNRSREHFEERGLETLFLACGMATWQNVRGAATPAAPVLLCPVTLRPRGAAREDFELSITADAEVNQTLLHALDADFECRCDPEQLLASAGIEGAIDTPDELSLAFSWLASHAANVPEFSIDERFVLGTFAYAKLPMVKDLEGSLEAMVRHDLIAALAGDDEARAEVRGRRVSVDLTQPNRTPPADEFLVLDADNSQNFAINALLGGQDMVIKGPPGTGKSQTIANLISTLVARGKRVLFVAEKRAAIDAVVRRLDDVGLADLVLDLHGGVGSRREIARTLADALAANASIARPVLDAEHRQLVARRDELNAHVDALHCARAPWELSLFEAQARLLRLSDAATDVRFRGPAVERLTGDVIEHVKEDLRAFTGLGGLTLRSSGSPWAKGLVISGEEGRRAQELIDGLLSGQLIEADRRLTVDSEASGLSVPKDFADWSERLRLWREVGRTLECFQPELFALELPALLPLLEPLGGSAGKRVSATLTSSEYRAARKTVKSYLRDGVKLAPPELLEAVEHAASQQAEWKRLSMGEAAPTVPQDVDDVASGFEQVQATLAELARLAGREAFVGSAENVREELRALRDDTVTLGKLPELHRLRAALTRAGLEELVVDLEGRRPSIEQAVASLDFAWLTSVVDHIRLSDARVGAFDGAHHSRTLADFQAADRRHIETTGQRVRRACAEQAVAAEEAFEDQGALIRDQAARKRKHLSVRQLFSAAPDVMTALKPCWAMSPLVVSQLLPGDRQYFDVVVFDEASQVRPAEAIPAILRGKRVIVAGDERQLPPTAFFTGADPETDSIELEGRVVVDGGYESILEALLPFLDFRMLQWHYRSRDERLIAFSNAHLYDRSLTTFPGVTGPDAIQHVLVPFEAGQHGSEDSTSAEVRRVVELILEHAQTRPYESLGVIAMGIKHADRIDESLRRVLAERPGLEDFFDETRPDRFFVKNLERVQGDERDAIILTVGYGKSIDGRMLYRFGPLNQEGGERRLNVAITRAKNRLTVVSSFAATDMDADRCTARGVDLLRLYLDYAASRGEHLDRQALETPELNPFEIDVRDTLTRAGVPLVCQLGASGYRIDFAAKHPTQPGRLVLAIETDGASYHSSPTARDRDRLRQEHLERLGWRFHRIWSQDWFADKETETEKVVEAYRAAVAAADAPEGEGASALRTRPRETPTPSTTPASETHRGPAPAVPPGLKIDEYTHGEIVSVVRWIGSDTLLRTRDQLLAETMAALGFQKRGSRIVAAINSAIDTVRGKPSPVPPPAPAPVPPADDHGRGVTVSSGGFLPRTQARPDRRNGGRAASHLPVDEVVVCVIDTETTGLRRQDRIVEIAAVRMTLAGEVLDEFETLVNPGRTVCDTTHIHGISDRDLLDAPSFEEVAGDLTARLGGAIWAAHNAPFDVRFLSREFERLGRQLPVWPTICTMRMARLHGSSGRLRLADCCEHYGVQVPNGLHRALTDARITAQLLARMSGRIGCRSVAQLGVCDGEEWTFPVPEMPNGLPHTGRRHVRGDHRPDLTIGAARTDGSTGATASGVERYFRAVQQAMEDRRLEEHEIDHLFTLATNEGLTPSQASEVHAAYVADVAARAYADGFLSDSERVDLELVGRLLEVGEEQAADIIAAEAVAAGGSVRTGDLAGKTVCFTGDLTDTRSGQPITRRDAHALAAQAGLVPVKSVTHGLDILVLADPYTVSNKAEKARAQGTRLVAAAAFWSEAGIAVD